MSSKERSIRPNFPPILSVESFEKSGIKDVTLKLKLEQVEKWFRFNPWLNFHNHHEWEQHGLVIKEGEEHLDPESYKKLRLSLKELIKASQAAIRKELDNEEGYLRKMSFVAFDFWKTLRLIKVRIDKKQDPSVVFKLYRKLWVDLDKADKAEPVVNEPKGNGPKGQKAGKKVG